MDEKSTIPPTNWDARELASGAPITPDHREINPATGMQKEYVVLTAAERAKGFVRPVRRSYVHVGKPPEGEKFTYPITKTFPGGCGTRTSMSNATAETYAREPKFYSGTFCCECRQHFDLDQFVWEGTDEQVGSQEDSMPKRKVAKKKAKVKIRKVVPAPPPLDIPLSDDILELDKVHAEPHKQTWVEWLQSLW